MVYDVTKEDSFASCAKWIQGVRKGREDRLPGVLVANKIDLEERRVVDEQRGRDFAKENGLVYFETSALQGNYEGPFRHVVLTQRLFPSISELQGRNDAPPRRRRRGRMRVDASRDGIDQHRLRPRRRRFY